MYFLRMLLCIVIVIFAIGAESYAAVSNSNPIRFKPRLFFWYTVNPGFPPKSEWKTGDNPISLYKEMQYGNMASRPGSKEYFIRLKKLGFDSIVLSGFHGPYNMQLLEPSFPGSLKKELQTRNANYYVPWSRDAGLEPFLLDMFLSEGNAEKFSWFDDKEWQKIEAHLRFVAKTAKELKCKGITFDFEPYNAYAKRNPWKLDRLVHEGYKRSDVLLEMQKRGRQMARAIYQEFPSAEIHMYDVGAGANSASVIGRISSIKQFVDDDFEDVIGFFLAGFLSEPLCNGVNIDDAATYYVYNPNEIEVIYRKAQMVYVENVTNRLKLINATNKNISIGLALLVHHRWNEKRWWDKVKSVNKDTIKNSVIKMMSIAPFVWVYPGETDWIYPEFADMLPVPAIIQIDDTPYSTFSQRMFQFSAGLREAVEEIRHSSRSK